MNGNESYEIFAKDDYFAQNQDKSNRISIQ